MVGLLLVAGVASCGTDGGGSDGGSATTAKPTRSGAWTVTPVGDSLLERYVAELDTALSGGGFTPGSHDFVKGGLTSEEIQPLLDDAVAAKPDAIVLSEGINDASTHVTGGTALNESDAQLLAISKEIVGAVETDLADLVRRGIRVVYVIPTFDRSAAKLLAEDQRARVFRLLDDLHARWLALSTRWPKQVCAVDLVALRAQGLISYPNDPLHPASMDAPFAEAVRALTALRDGKPCPKVTAGP